MPDRVGGTGSEVVTAVLAEVRRRRAAGEDLPDAEVVEAHPELMPALGTRWPK